MAQQSKEYTMKNKRKKHILDSSWSIFFKDTVLRIMLIIYVTVSKDITIV